MGVFPPPQGRSDESLKKIPKKRLNVKGLKFGAMLRDMRKHFK